MAVMTKKDRKTFEELRQKSVDENRHRRVADMIPIAKGKHRAPLLDCITRVYGDNHTLLVVRPSRNEMNDLIEFGRAFNMTPRVLGRHALAMRLYVESVLGRRVVESHGEPYDDKDMPKLEIRAGADVVEDIRGLIGMSRFGGRWVAQALHWAMRHEFVFSRMLAETVTQKALVSELVKNGWNDSQKMGPRFGIALRAVRQVKKVGFASIAIGTGIEVEHLKKLEARNSQVTDGQVAAIEEFFSVNMLEELVKRVRY